MKLIDIREIWKDDLCDLEYQRSLLQVMYEEGGAEGILQGLREIAIAEGKTPLAARAIRASSNSARRVSSRKGNPAFKTVQNALNSVGLDLAIVPRGK